MSCPHVNRWTRESAGALKAVSELSVLQSQPVLPFWPKYYLGHPKNYLILLLENIFIASTYPE